jgi:hypothetical protein
LLVLDGSNNLIAFGATSVDVSMKNIRRRNTKSDIEAVLNEELILFLVFIAIALN